MEVSEKCFSDKKTANHAFVIGQGKKTKKSILLIHGLGDSPYYFRDIAIVFHMYGYNVVGVRLSGHGTHPKHLEKTALNEWQEDIEFGYELAKKYGDEVIVGGLSTGATLIMNEVLENQEKYKTQKFLLFSPVLKYQNILYNNFCNDNKLESVFESIKKESSRDIPHYSYFIKYPYIATNAICESVKSNESLLEKMILLKENRGTLKHDILMVLTESDDLADIEYAIGMFKLSSENSHLIIYVDEDSDMKKDLTSKYKIPENKFSLIKTNLEIKHQAVIHSGNGYFPVDEFNYKFSWRFREILRRNFEMIK